MANSATMTSERQQALTNTISKVFYYLLYIENNQAFKNSTKQTQQFKTAKVTFFKQDSMEWLQQVSHLLLVLKVLESDGATLKSNNQNNSHKEACKKHKANGNIYSAKCIALDPHYVHICQHTFHPSIFLLTHFDNSASDDIMYKGISPGL